MKKIYFILAAMLLAEMTGAVTNHLYAQESLPQWGEELLTLNPDIIDSIHYYDPDEPRRDAEFYPEQFRFLFHGSRALSNRCRKYRALISCSIHRCPEWIA